MLLLSRFCEQSYTGLSANRRTPVILGRTRVRPSSKGVDGARVLAGPSRVPSYEALRSADLEVPNGPKDWSWPGRANADGRGLSH